MNVHALQEDDLRKDIFDIGQSPDSRKKVQLSLGFILRVSEHLANGWINDEILQILIDSLNLHNNFVTTLQTPYPKHYCMNGLAFNKLYIPFCQYKDKNNDLEFSINSSDFASKLKGAIKRCN